MGRAGAKNWQLLPFIIDNDGTFVTRNAYDSRGPIDRPGSKGEYTRTDIHAGLVCPNGPPEGMDLALHCELFEIALEEHQMQPDLVNQVLEVTLDALDGEVAITRYSMPAS